MSQLSQPQWGELLDAGHSLRWSRLKLQCTGRREVRMECIAHADRCSAYKCRPVLCLARLYLVTRTAIRASTWLPACWRYSPHHTVGFSWPSTHQAAVTARRGETRVAPHICRPLEDRIEQTYGNLHQDLNPRDLTLLSLKAPTQVAYGARQEESPPLAHRSAVACRA